MTRKQLQEAQCHNHKIKDIAVGKSRKEFFSETVLTMPSYRNITNFRGVYMHTGPEHNEYAIIGLDGVMVDKHIGLHTVDVEIQLATLTI